MTSSTRILAPYVIAASDSEIPLLTTQLYLPYCNSTEFFVNVVNDRWMTGAEVQEFRLETIGPSGDCAILQVTGEVDVCNAPILRERIRGLAATSTVHVIADLSRVDFLDSTGLGVLVGGLKRLREHDGSLVLVISATRILRIFEVTGLTRVFLPQPSVLAAITADPHWRQVVESKAGSAGKWCRQHGLS
jgi:anti-sigma B factor antagonist